MKRLTELLAAGCAAWDWFFFAAVDLRLCAILRIGFAGLLLLDLVCQWPFLDFYYGEQGGLPYSVSREYIYPGSLSPLGLAPAGMAWLLALYLLFGAQVVLLGLGLFTRVQSVGVFLWLVSFQQRNQAIRDGEDVVFRMFAFLLIFLPLGAVWSLDARRRNGRADAALQPRPKWPLRLMQFQTCLILLASGIYKTQGVAWRKGDALYYVSRLEDAFDPFWAPAAVFDSLPLLRAAAWGIVLAELVIPFAIWIPRLRLPCLIVACSLHLAIDYAMNMFLFQWIMMFGWLTFLEPKEVNWLLGLPAAARHWLGRGDSRSA
ncbi:MAG: HTTM domain-containing protein [Pirellulales bacterium]